MCQRLRRLGVMQGMGVGSTLNFQETCLISELPRGRRALGEKMGIIRAARHALRMNRLNAGSIHTDARP